MMNVILSYKNTSITKLVFVLLCVFGFESYTQAQSIEGKAILELKQVGFENIRVIQQKETIVCTIERGLQRSPAEDFKTALAILQRTYNPTCIFRIILLEQGLPVFELKSNDQSTENFNDKKSNNLEQSSDIHVYYSDKEFFNRIKKIPVVHPARTGLTVTLYPQLTLQNMYISRIYEEQFNLAPAVSYSGWNGMMFTAQLILPIINELNYEGDYIRFGFITFTQSLKLPHLNQLRFTVGNFNNHRYGFDMKWKKQIEYSRWSFGANIGYTGYSNNYNGYWNHRAISDLTWNIKTSYFLPSPQLRADLTLGKFIAGDNGFRMDIYRHFGEATIGFYATYTGHYPNGGFHFSIPISPVKRKHAYRLRVMLPSYFDMEYNARNEFVYNRYYETSPDENRSAQDLYPQLIQKQIINP